MSFNFYKQMKMVLLLVVGLFLSSGLYAQLTGTKTIDPAGSGPNNYFSVAQAVLDLNAVGVGAGGVTFNVPAGLTLVETADIVLTTTTSDATKPIIFQRSGAGANPIIRAKAGTIATTTYGNNGDAVIKLVSTDYVTFNGLEFRGPAVAGTNTLRTEYGILLAKSPTDACKNITVKNCTFSLDKANAYSIGIYQSNLLTAGTAATVTSEGGRSENNLFVNNAFTNTYNAVNLTGFSHTTAPFQFLDNNNVVLNNTVETFGGSSVTCYGIYNNNQDSLIVRGNTINGGAGNTTTLYGIYNTGGTNTSLTYSSNTITFSNTGTSTYYGIYILGTATGTNSIVNVDSNSLQNSVFTSTGILYGIYAGGGPKTLNFRYNKITNNNYNGTSYLFYIAGTNTITDAIVHHNTIEGIRRNTATGTGTLYGLYLQSFRTVNAYNNTVRDIFNKAGHTGALYPSYCTATAVSVDFYDNTIDSIYSNGTGSIYGAYFSNTTTTNRNIYRNKISRIYGQGGSLVYGMYLSSGDTTNVYRNKISQVKLDSARSLTLSGMYVASGTGYNIYNNYIQELSAPNAFNSSTTSNGAVSGLYITSTDAKAYNNTIYLDGTSTTVNTNGFGSDAIYVTSTPASIDLRNNIIINKTTPVLPGRAVALRRASTSTVSLNALMNNNIYYTAFSPTGSTPLYFDGTNVDTTIELLKARLSPAESNGVSEDVPFVNNLNLPYDLHISPNTPTRVEGGASVEPMVTTDYDGNARNVNTPDIGADEGVFTPVAGDFAGPTITAVSITPNTVQCNALPHIITATITDASGVLNAKIVWTADGVAQTPINMTRGAANVWTGTIPAQYSTNSSIQVAWNLSAQDSALIPNSKSYLGTTYKDAALYISAGYTGTDSVNAGAFIQFNAKATPTNVNPGTNNTGNNSNTTPFYRGWGGNKRQFLYRATELASAGLPAGGITAITFDVITNTGAITLQPGFTLYIDSTNVSVAGTTYLTPTTVIYGPADYTPTYGANTFALSTPFVWNGTSNIYVTACWSDGTTGGTTTTYYVKNSTTSFASTTYNNIDSQTPAAVCATASGSAQSSRPDILFSYNPPRTISWTSTGAATLSATNILNPTATLTTPGNYQFIVSVSDGVCSNSDTVKIVAVTPKKPIADFSASATTANIGGSFSTVTFTDLSTNVPDKWKWVFTPSTVNYVGGTNDSSQNPQVTFNGRGPYTVKLTVSNLGGSDDTIRTNYINTIVSYCASGATSTADDDIGNVSIFDFATQATLLSNGVDSPATPRADANKLYTNWTDSTNVVVPNLYKGDKYTLRVGRIWSGTAYSNYITAFIDYNNNGSFDDAGEMIDVGASLTSTIVNRSSVVFTVPCTADTGYLRMRVIVEEFGTAPRASCGTFSWGETEDYKIRVLPTQLMYDSSAAYQAVLTDVQPNTNNNQVIGLKVLASGCDGNLAATNINISMTGTTNLADVSNAKLWYTGSSKVFATTSQYDVTKTASATLSFTGNQALLADTNYFWLTYDLATNATLGNSIDAVVNSVTVGGIAQTPAITSPAGSRLINFPASIVSNNLIQNSANVEINTSNNVILTGRVVMSAFGAAVPLSEVKVALTGTTLKSDLSSVKVWSSGSNKLFNPATATQFDSTKTILSDTLTFTGNRMIGVDTNYLWVTYGIKSNAVIGNFVDAEVLSYTINNIVSVPTNTNPAGNRKITNPYCPITASYDTDEDIGKVVFGSFSNGIDTPIAANSTAIGMYTNFTALPGLVGQKSVNTPISVSIINRSSFLYTASVNVFIDYNQNGLFDLPQERVFKAISANTLSTRTVSGNVIIPSSALNGPTRMRVIASETTLADLDPCLNILWGEIEDYTINIIPPPPGDYYGPDFISKTASPAGGACSSSPHTISVVVTDTTAVDTVYMHWSINNVAQAPVIMTAGANNTYSTVIPSAGTNVIAYSFSAVDVSANRNRSTYAGGQYADEQLKSKLVSTPDGYIGVGGSYQLGAFISNAVKLGSGTTTTTSTPNPYYTTWWGNKEQYLIRASELLAGGYTAGAITSIGLQVGAVTTTLSLTDFTVSIKQSSITALTSSFETGLTPVYSNPAYTVLPNAMNTHTFTSPFIWDGVSSLIIETCFNNSAWNGSQTIEYTTTAFAASLYSTQDNATVCSNPTGTIVNSRPNFFIGQPVTVNYAWVNPTNGGLSATNIPNPMASPTGGLGTYAYIVNISDSVCTISDTINVNIVPPPVVNLGPNRTLCTGSTVTLDAGNAGSSFMWSTGATTQTIDVTVGATYIVTVTNQANLIARDTIVLTQIASPTAAIVADTLYTCVGTGVTLDAGNAGATYLWSNGATTQTIVANSEGVYRVAVTNSGGCTVADSVRIIYKLSPVVSLGADQSICAGTPVPLDAGNTGATYLWSNGATTQTITINQPGTYSVTVTNLEGCSAKDTIIINSKPLPVVSLGADKAKCPSDSVTLDAGAGFTSYLWNSGATTQSIRTATAGVYVVMVTNADGCAGRDTLIVTNNAVPVVNLGADKDNCTSDTVTLDAGNAGSTYLWSTGATTQTIKVSLAGTYSVTVTNTFGCVSSDAVVFTNKPVPISTYSVTTANGQSVTFLATATAGLQYAWNFGDPTSAANTSQLASPTHVFSAADSFTVTLTVTNVATGCRSTTSTRIAVTGLGNDFAEVFKLGAAPNPFAGQTLITYVLPENANNVSAEVYDMIGRKVADIITNESQAAGKYQFDYKNEDLQTASGVYMVRLTVDGKVAYIRIVDIAKK